jgi:hypothetical protein
MMASLPIGGTATPLWLTTLAEQWSEALALIDRAETGHVFGSELSDLHRRMRLLRRQLARLGLVPE